VSWACLTRLGRRRRRWLGLFAAWNVIGLAAEEKGDLLAEQHAMVVLHLSDCPAECLLLHCDSAKINNSRVEDPVRNRLEVERVDSDRHRLGGCPTGIVSSAKGFYIVVRHTRIEPARTSCQKLIPFPLVKFTVVRHDDRVDEFYWYLDRRNCCRLGSQPGSCARRALELRGCERKGNRSNDITLSKTGTPSLRVQGGSVFVREVVEPEST
jgi:hypothetical protein